MLSAKCLAAVAVTASPTSAARANAILPASPGAALGLHAFANVLTSNALLRHCDYVAYATGQEGPSVGETLIAGSDARRLYQHSGNTRFNSPVQDDFLFSVVPGLNNDSSSISLQSYAIPDHYLCVGCVAEGTSRSTSAVAYDPSLRLHLSNAFDASNASWLLTEAQDSVSEFSALEILCVLVGCTPSTNC
jgi:hypothetical protein